MKTKSFLFLLLILCSIGVTIFLFQPGYMNSDALDQLEQGRSGLYNDWHPPVMSWIWGHMDQVTPGPLGMLVLQVTLFWSGLGILIAQISPKPINRSLYLLIGFYPPIFMLLGAITKDVLMTAAFLFGFSLILHSEKRKSITPFIFGMIFLGLGMLTRHNATLAALPLFLYSGHVFIKLYPAIGGRLSLFWKTTMAGFVFFSTLLILGYLWSGSLTQVKSYPFQQIMAHDVTGISVKTKTNLLPPYLASDAQPSLKDLRHIYQASSVKNLYWPDFTIIHLKILYDPAQVAELTGDWAKTVIKYPRVYLNLRRDVFSAVLGIYPRQSCNPYYYEKMIYKPKGYYQNDGSNYYSDHPATDRLFMLIEPLRSSFIYWSWLYVLFSVVMFAASLLTLWKFRHTENPPAVMALALSASGTLYGLAYFFVATACDFRMVHWDVILALLSPLILIHSWTQKSGPS